MLALFSCFWHIPVLTSVVNRELSLLDLLWRRRRSGRSLVLDSVIGDFVGAIELSTVYLIQICYHRLYWLYIIAL